jgi:hypothetical protein
MAWLLCCFAASALAQSGLQPGFFQQWLEDVGGRTRAWGMAVADFTGDGISDILSGDTFGDVHLLVGAGDGTFTDQGVVINMSFHDAYGMAAADFNRDGAQDFVLSRTSTAGDGNVMLYLGNGNGTFQSTGFPQEGRLVGDAGTDVMVLAAGDVDGDGDADLVAGDVAASEDGRATVTLFRNELEVLGGSLTWNAEVLILGVDRGFSPDPEDPPYFPPKVYLHAYGLALADVDNDGDADLLVGDIANYLYVYRNDGTGSFQPVRFETIGTRPYAMARLHENFTAQMALAAGDLNGDGWVDLVSSVQTSGTGTYPGQVDAWIHEGLDALNRPSFGGTGVVGAAGKDVRGLAIGQLDPFVDLAADVAFGNYEGNIYGLFTDLEDSDGDGIIDSLDNAPDDYNPAVLDMNTDGSLNRFDQLDADHDGIGDPADEDDDNDGIEDAEDNCPWSANADQSDIDGDLRGDACDPTDQRDPDGDGVGYGPTDPELYPRARAAKGMWSSGTTHFIVRIDALGRAFQNEFTQIMSDAAILSSSEWEMKKFDSYNGIGDAPALPGYQVPEDLAGGLQVPISLVLIPKQIFNAFGDPDPIWWMNDRNGSMYLELAQHGTYHANNTPLGDWATIPDRFYYSCETCGLPVDAVYQYLRVGTRTMLGQYEIDPWIMKSGAGPGSDRIDWSDAAHPLISYAPPFNASDTPSRDATASLGFVAFSASIYEEESDIFTPEGSHHEMFDPFGMYHASADHQVDPEVPDGMTYEEYLASITQWGSLNTWLIEEVEWSTRYCNDRERLVGCAAAPGGVNRENNMVDPARWSLWLALLQFVRDNGVPMTLGDYSLAMATDNCPGLANPGQEDVDHDGNGDVCDLEQIDIKPGSETNPINPWSQGVIPVAILGTPLLDLSKVDLASLRFGPGLAEASGIPRWEDVNDDGLVDLVIHFSTRDSGIEWGMTEACLEGTIGATPFVACNPIRTVPPGLGSIPDGSADAGEGLRLQPQGDEVVLTWQPSCTQQDYVVYRGSLKSLASKGVAASHVLVESTGGTTEAADSVQGGDLYYLVAPHDGRFEGTYGFDGSGVQRPQSERAPYARSTEECGN